MTEDKSPTTDDKQQTVSGGSGQESAGGATVTGGEKKGEKSSLITSQGDVDSSKNLIQLYKAALTISWISILFSLASGIAAIVLSFEHESESLFAYGLDAVLDSFSSVAVVWRFSDSTDHAKGRVREYKACLAIGILFLVSALSLISRSIVAIVNETREDRVVTLFIEFSVICGLASLAIGLTKAYVGVKVGSQALYTDSVITLVGAAACFLAWLGLELYMVNRDLWFLDSVFGILCGIVLIGFGIRLLVNTLKDRPKELSI